MLHDGVQSVIKKDSYPILPIFNMLQKDGSIQEQMMYNTYNMGIGMMVVVDSSVADEAVNAIKASGEKAYIIGEIKSGDKGVTLC